MYTIYNCQFCVGPTPFIIDSSWKYMDVGDGQVLSYHNKTKIQYKSRRFVVIGLVEEGDESRKRVSELNDSDIDFNFVRRLTDTWVGRWIIISNGKIILDSWGSIGIYFLKNVDQIEEKWFFSSCSLLCKKFGLQLQADKLGKDLMTDEKTLLPYINLTPMEFLDINTGIRYPLCQPIFLKFDNMNATLAAKRIVSLISTAINRLDDPLIHWHLPLTGGRDSRLSGIALKKGCVSFSSFTFKKPWYGTSYVDKFLPKKIAKIFNIKHSTLDASYINSKAEILQDLKIHLGSTDVKDESPGSIGYYFSRGHWLKVGVNGVLVTSLYYDLIEGTYANFNRDLSWLKLNGYSVDKHSLNLRLKILDNAFWGFEDNELNEKGAIYWCLRQKALAIAMTALEYSGNIVFAPGVCAEISSLGLSCDRNEIISNSIHVEAMKLYSEKLSSVPFDCYWDEPQKYFSYIKRGCPGLIKRILSKFLLVLKN